MLFHDYNFDSFLFFLRLILHDLKVAGLTVTSVEPVTQSTDELSFGAAVGIVVGAMMIILIVLLVVLIVMGYCWMRLVLAYMCAFCPQA